jgi:MEMO1 family protein
MRIRRRSLPRGWYPDGPEALGRTVSSWVGVPIARGDREVAGGAREGGARPGSAREGGGGALAVVAPHAGWAFSGRLAARAFAALAPASTVAVIGGHLGGGAAPLAAFEDAFETPLGNLASDVELRDALASELSRRRGLGLEEDREADNTVEVQLPLVACLVPGARVLWLRAPNGPEALALGEALRAAASSLGRSVSCVGSTDLTHYGPNYGFSPAGSGSAAEAWARKNDGRFIDAVLALDGRRAVELGEAERSACSSGAAAAAVAFARSSGATDARLIEYATSLDLRRDDSFVGYAAIAFY